MFEKNFFSILYIMKIRIFRHWLHCSTIKIDYNLQWILKTGKTT